jgi:hypothetical protein
LPELFVGCDSVLSAETNHLFAEQIAEAQSLQCYSVRFLAKRWTILKGVTWYCSMRFLSTNLSWLMTVMIVIFDFFAVSISAHTHCDYQQQQASIRRIKRIETPPKKQLPCKSHRPNTPLNSKIVVRL